MHMNTSDLTCFHFKFSISENKTDEPHRDNNVHLTHVLTQITSLKLSDRVTLDEAKQ